MRNIKQNLFWAFGYNVLLIPVAAGAFILPLDATFAGAGGGGDGLLLNFRGPQRAAATLVFPPAAFPGERSRPARKAKYEQAAEKLVKPNIIGV